MVDFVQQRLQALHLPGFIGQCGSQTFQIGGERFGQGCLQLTGQRIELGADLLHGLIELLSHLPLQGLDDLGQPFT